MKNRNMRIAWPAVIWISILCSVCGAQPQAIKGSDKPAATPEKLTATQTTEGPADPIEVNAMWGVLGSKVAHDVFGRSVSKQFHVIELVLDNRTDTDIQLSGVGFSRGNSPTALPASGYRVVRGVLVRGQDTDVRNRLIGTIRAVGPMLTGFGFFLKNVVSKATYERSVDIFSNPFEKGLEAMIPDITVRHTTALDEQGMRDTYILAKKSQARTVVFVDKSQVEIPPSRKKPTPRQVQDALGELKILGYVLNRGPEVPIAVRR